MFEAQYLFSGDDVYSPWMSRNADNLIITLDLIATTGGTGEFLTVEVYEKNSETTGDGAPYENPPGTVVKLEADTVDQHSKAGYNGVLELVRFKISAGGTGKRFLFRMLSNVWYDDVNATGA